MMKRISAERKVLVLGAPGPSQAAGVRGDSGDSGATESADSVVSQVWLRCKVIRGSSPQPAEPMLP